MLPALPSRPAGASTLYALLGILLLAAGLLAVIMPYKVRPADLWRGLPDQGHVPRCSRLPACACNRCPNAARNICSQSDPPPFPFPSPSVSSSQLTDLFFRNMHLPHKYEDIGECSWC